MDPARPALRDVGRAARLEIAFERRGGRTVLARAFAEPPLRIGPTFDIGDAAYVIAVCTGPGVFAGDTLRLCVRVAAGARAVIASQAALQVHPSAAAAPARVHHEYVVEAGGELHGHWDPVIPFAHTRLEQRFDLRVAEGGRLYWSDALMSGRASRGEAWQFAELSHELRIATAHPQYVERYTLRPRERDCARPWIAGDAHYVATTIVHDARATGDAAEALHRCLAASPGVAAAADLVEPGLLVARLAAVSGPPFAAARAAARSFVLDRIFQAPELAGRK